MVGGPRSSEYLISLLSQRVLSCHLGLSESVTCYWYFAVETWSLGDEDYAPISAFGIEVIRFGVSERKENFKTIVGAHKGSTSCAFCVHSFLAIFGGGWSSSGQLHLQGLGEVELFRPHLTYPFFVFFANKKCFRFAQGFWIFSTCFSVVLALQSFVCCLMLCCYFSCSLLRLDIFSNSWLSWLCFGFC